MEIDPLLMRGLLVMISPSRREVSPAEQLRQSPRLIPPRFRDRGKGVPSFDEMMDIALVEVDFDNPTTNVRGRRALAIAKPTPRGIDPDGARST